MSREQYGVSDATISFRHYNIIEGGSSLHDEQGEVYGSQQKAEAEKSRSK
jgi:hypothetical protein